MLIISDADKIRHRAAAALRREAPPAETGLSSEDESKLWELIEGSIVPQLVSRMVQQTKIGYSSGRTDIGASCSLRIDSSLLPEGTTMLTMAKLQLMLDRIVDFHPLRDPYDTDVQNAQRLREAFEKAIETIDPSFRIEVEPKWFALNSLNIAGKMDAKHIETLVVLEPRPASANAGPRRFRNETRWTEEISGPRRPL